MFVIRTAGLVSKSVCILLYCFAETQRDEVQRKSVTYVESVVTSVS